MKAKGLTNQTVGEQVGDAGGRAATKVDKRTCPQSTKCPQKYSYQSMKRFDPPVSFYAVIN